MMSSGPHVMFHELWWTTSGGSTFIPSSTEDSASSSSTSSSNSNSAPSSIPASDSSGTGGANFPTDTTSTMTSNELTTITTSIPVSTITNSSTTSTSFSRSTLTSSIPSSPASGSGDTFSSTSPFPSSSTPTGALDAGNVCIGDSLDSGADGIIASIVLPSVIGLIIWILFALLRPRFRQVYGPREWFLPQNLRPKPLSTSFFAFLFPHVPLIPPVPSDVSDAGRSDKTDSELFPSDEQLGQRAIWICLLIALGWMVLALAGALPIYMVTLPCLADQNPTSTYGGGYTTLQDLSLARLLQLVDSGNVTTSNLITFHKRADDAAVVDRDTRIRLIVLTVLVLVVGLLPALFKVMREFTVLVDYRKRWIQVKCEGLEMGWLSVRDAPGFAGWGEQRLKQFLKRAGLGASVDGVSSREGSSQRRARDQSPSRRGRSEDQPLNPDDTNEVDIHGVFSINDTHRLALLIDDRDVVLEELEIAETKYISSFRLTTPDPSIASFEPRVPVDPNRPYISRPKPLQNSRRPSRRRNPALAASSLAETSFVLPSQYYKIRGVHGLTGGRFAGSRSLEKIPTFSDSVHSRVVGSRFQEIHPESARYGPLPLGSHVDVGEHGELVGDTASWNASQAPDPRRYSPNHPGESSRGVEEERLIYDSPDERSRLETLHEEEDWVDLQQETSPNMQSEENRPPRSSPFGRRPRLPKKDSTRRETFPFRRKADVEDDDNLPPPPHLRVQHSQPFVRPNDGVDYDNLGDVYNSIQYWRSRLKAINTEIAEAQRESYTDIAEGNRVKGWLMVGKGLRHLGNIQLIEGRAKEDIRWDVLQHERTILDSFVLWAVVGVVAILLAVGLTAATGLAVATAPDVAHYLPFLAQLLDNNSLATGSAILLAPAVAASLFVFLAVATVHWAANVRGSISVSGDQLLIFKTTFVVLTLVASLWLLTIGGLLFSLHAFSTGSGEASSVADGSIYIMALALSILMQLAIIVPGLLLLQPIRLWRVVRTEKNAVTPRQRFRAIYPSTYDPSYATGACILAIIFASTFAVIFPLISPAVVVLLLLTLIAHRFLVGYVYGRTHSQTGGLLQIWLLRRFGTLLAFQPILLGLIFLTRRLWIEGGVLVGTGVAVILFVEAYTTWKTRLPGRRSLSSSTQESLDMFDDVAKYPQQAVPAREESEGSDGTPPGLRARGSMASVLDMMSQTLAVTPSRARGPVPLQTETLDDLIATERAARTHPDAPPRLPQLPFGSHADEMANILYAPELTAPPPIIWLPNDSAGVARSEAEDLRKYHDLEVTLDVRTRDDVMDTRSTPPRFR